MAEITLKPLADQGAKFYNAIFGQRYSRLWYGKNKQEHFSAVTTIGLSV